MKSVIDSIRQLFWLGNRKRKNAKTEGNFRGHLLNCLGIGRLAGIFTTVLALLLVGGFNSEALAQDQEISSNQFDTLVLSFQSLSSAIETLRTLMIAGFVSTIVVAVGVFWALNKKIDGFENRVNTKFDSMKEDVNTKSCNLKENVNTQFLSLKDLISENRKNNQEVHHRQELLLKEVLWYVSGGKSGSIPEMPNIVETNEGEDKTIS